MDEYRNNIRIQCIESKIHATIAKSGSTTFLFGSNTQLYKMRCSLVKVNLKIWLFLALLLCTWYCSTIPSHTRREESLSILTWRNASNNSLDLVESCKNLDIESEECRKLWNTRYERGYLRIENFVLVLLHRQDQNGKWWKFCLSLVC